MLDADELIVAEDSASNLQTKFNRWQMALESKGLKMNVGKTESKVCSKLEEPLTITGNNGNTMKQVDSFKYL